MKDIPEVDENIYEEISPSMEIKPASQASKLRPTPSFHCVFIYPSTITYNVRTCDGVRRLLDHEVVLIHAP